MNFLQAVFHRRSFVRQFGGTAAVCGSAGLLQPQSVPAGQWQPAREAQDAWLDRIAGKHRMVFDATTPEGFGYALLFANNYFIREP